MDAAPLNAACLTAFGIPATVRHGSLSTPLRAVFELAATRFNNRGQSGAPGDYALEGAVLEKTDAVMTALSPALRTAKIEPGDRVAIAGNTYRVVDVLDDRDGMTDVILRADWR